MRDDHDLWMDKVTRALRSLRGEPGQTRDAGHTTEGGEPDARHGERASATPDVID